jgi:hypothetical protein
MCAVIDVMHSVQHGVIMYVLVSFKKCLSSDTMAMLDRMALVFLTSLANKLFVKTFPELISHVASPTLPFLSALNNQVLYFFLLC